ncbi:phage tail fiber C-terminal domain-containing protein [Escherichia coli]|nr:phage tail fiber C-terminal domain-containing protein [Escherichia coli]EKO8903444.1 phage tail fiber C-terminal domain-containing protein [Escherichia coli]HCP2893080.1 phage tail fiber C-terminal domain-containing protein [Escherichia coli]HCP4544653.1 phage tail fiber C-terminal domain-containing protein [Escherichia coli]
MFSTSITSSKANKVITQVVILDADKKQIQCVVRPLQILRADGTWENIGGMK